MRYERYTYKLTEESDAVFRRYLGALTRIHTFDVANRTIGRRPERKRRPGRSCRSKKTAKSADDFDGRFFVATQVPPYLFGCPICRELVRSPVTIECGHTFCSKCLECADGALCVVCGADIGDKRCVNVLIQGLIDKWRDANKDTPNLDTFEVMGIEPRYRLRSGFAGMQLSSETRDTMSKFLKAVGSPYTRRENWKRTKIKKRHDEVSQENLLMFFDTILDTVRKAKEKALRASWKCIAGSDLECILCSRCLMEPVTTGCGHTFCRDCLTRVLDYGLSCPLCKSQLTVSDYARGYTMALGRAITFLARKEFDERISVTLEEGIVFGKNSDIPVFVCTTAFPNVACPLYVYEPRYRLMVRRCLHSPTKLFAMAAKDSNGFSSYGTVLKIKDAVTLNDGRFILTTVGLRRFKVLSRSEQDGYDTAKVQYIQDSAVSADKLQELIGLHCKVYGKATKWISSLKPKVMSEVERLIGQMPPIEANWTSLPDGPSWTWWLMPLLPLSSKLQIGFLSTTSLDKRLRAIDKMLEHMKGRMNGYERNPNCYEASDVAPSESCQYVLPFHVQ